MLMLLKIMLLRKGEILSIKSYEYIISTTCKDKTQVSNLDFVFLWLLSAGQLFCLTENVLAIHFAAMTHYREFHQENPFGITML